MTNEVSNVTSVTYTPRPYSVGESKSAAHSESGKQVPPPGETQPETAPTDTAQQEADLRLAVEKLAEHSRNLGRELQFEIDSDSGTTVVKVVDPETEEVVRQIPSEEAMERARSRDTSAMNLIDDIV
ncbi:MAG: flagellar protein FlaG [Pseudomonadota bacterium]